MGAGAGQGRSWEPGISARNGSMAYKSSFFTWAFPLKAYIDAAQCLRLGRAGGAGDKESE